MELLCGILIWLGGLVTGLAFGKILSEEYEKYKHRKFWQDSSKLIADIMKILNPLFLTRIGMQPCYFDTINSLFQPSTEKEEKSIPSFVEIEKKRLEELKERLKKKGFHVPDETLKLFLDMDDEQIVKILQAFS